MKLDKNHIPFTPQEDLYHKLVAGLDLLEKRFFLDDAAYSSIPGTESVDQSRETQPGTQGE